MQGIMEGELDEPEEENTSILSGKTSEELGFALRASITCLENKDALILQLQE